MTNRFAAGALAVLPAALILGTLANVVSPNRIDWIGDWTDVVSQRAATAGLVVINRRETQAIVEAGHGLILDARPGPDYEAGHIPGALSLPYKDVERAYASLHMIFDPKETILVYCAGRECDESVLLGAYLKAQGLTNLLLYAGGYSDWLAGQAP